MEQRRGLLLALIAIVTVAAAVGCGSSGNKPATQASPTQPTATQAVTPTQPPAPQEFVSKRYDFRVTLTKYWSGDDASLDWDGKKLQGIDSPAFANFVDSEDRTLVAAAAPVAKGTQLAEWRAAMVRAAPPFCAESSSVEKTTLGGEPALAWTATCSDGYHVNKLPPCTETAAT